MVTATHNSNYQRHIAGNNKPHPVPHHAAEAKLGVARSIWSKSVRVPAIAATGVQAMIDRSTVIA